MPQELIIGIIVALLLVIITNVISYKMGINHRKKVAEEQYGSAEQRARSIVDEAIKEAESVKREAGIAVKEETFKLKNELEQEVKERRNELSRLEKRVVQKEESLDKKAADFERKEQSLADREASLKNAKQEVEELKAQHLSELEKISSLSVEQAKEYLLQQVREEVQHESAIIIKEYETKVKEESNKRAKEILSTAVQRCASDYVAESTVSVVNLPNDEMKGRIIGREGRNIRALETLTGVDFIIDDTPEAVILSGFDPMRRDIARIALEKLIVDGRIHPARIEEMVEKAKKEVDESIREAGENAVMDAGVHGIHPDLIKILGRMKYRTSYGQNVLKHSVEVAILCGLIAHELGADVKLAKRAGLLHDIGKAIDHETEGSHVEIGVNLCKKYKENKIVINAVHAHHNDVEPETDIAVIVQAADTISAARPGARRETLESYVTRLTKLEEIADGFEGVDKSFAIQAGREVRVMVVPEKVSDDKLVLLSREVAKKIEEELDYPGQIKINLIRETRAVNYAK